MLLVTGGTGFIGKHLLEELKKKEIEYFNLSRKEGIDLRDFDKVYKFLENIKDGEVEGVVHLAAFVGSPESIEKPREFIENNVISTLNILEIMRKFDINYIIFASSGAVYGEPIYAPIDEKHPLNPLSPYGLSKKICEEMIFQYSELYGLKSCILRIFYVYGEGGKGKINVWLENAKRGEPIIVSKINQTRDFIYVKDVVNIILSAFNKKIIGIYNVGTGKECRIADIAKFIAEKFNVKIIIKEKVEESIERYVANIKRLREWYKKEFTDVYEWINNYSNNTNP